LYCYHLMKRFLAVILSLLYISTVTGTTVHLHYCMDKLVAWGLGSGKKNSGGCSYCGMVETAADKNYVKEAKDCCHDEDKQVKVEKDQKTVDAGFKLERPIFFITAPLRYNELSPTDVFYAVLEYPLTHAPPRAGKISLLVRYCVFRI
jgi:hypothetical protein